MLPNFIAVPIRRFSLFVVSGCYTCHTGTRIFQQFAIIIADDGAHLVSE